MRVIDHWVEDGESETRPVGALNQRWARPAAAGQAEVAKQTRKAKVADGETVPAGLEAENTSEM